jgi:hypothetical protein
LIRIKPRGSITGPMSLRITPATATGGVTANIIAGVSSRVPNPQSYRAR